jgi:hypothetical protein
MDRCVQRAMRSVVCLAAAGWLLANGKLARADADSAKGSVPARPAAALISAWEEAGADFGWMREDESGSLQFIDDEDPQPGDLPAFSLGSGFRLPAGTIASLPKPAEPFGLYLYQTSGVADTFKELAALKQLRVLDVEGGEGADKRARLNTFSPAKQRKQGSQVLRCQLIPKANNNESTPLCRLPNWRVS